MGNIKQLLRSFAAESPLQRLTNPFPQSVPFRLFLKRDDLLHPLVSGNKWRKLKYNLLAAYEQEHDTLLTFGGAYSNHLYATAAAGRALGFRTIGIVRGDELANAPRNPTLAFCEACGMQLHFVSRADYRRRNEPDYVAELVQRFGNCYVLPEGGTNELAIQGTAEIMPELVEQLGYAPDYVGCAVGTGGTVEGLLESASVHTRVLGFLALQAPGFTLPRHKPLPPNGSLITEYAFGGYARTTPALLAFMTNFEARTGILLDPVYTAKLLYGVYELAQQGFFTSDATVVAIHTGGLQGRSRLLEEREKYL